MVSTGCSVSPRNQFKDPRRIVNCRQISDTLFPFVLHRDQAYECRSRVRSLSSFHGASRSCQLLQPFNLPHHDHRLRKMGQPRGNHRGTVPRPICGTSSGARMTTPRPVMRSWRTRRRSYNLLIRQSAHIARLGEDVWEGTVRYGTTSPSETGQSSFYVRHRRRLAAHHAGARDSRPLTLLPARTLPTSAGRSACRYTGSLRHSRTRARSETRPDRPLRVDSRAW